MKLNFSCGKDIKKGFVNCDVQIHKDIVYCDMNKFPYPFEDNTFDYIFLKGAFCYAEDPERVLFELRRILKNNAIIKIEEIPFYNNKGAVTLMGTKSFYSETTFPYFVSCANGKHYCYFKTNKKFEINELELIPSKLGKWIYPKWLRMKLSNFFGGIINSINVELKVFKN